MSLLIDASHKTSTIRDHSSSFLPLLLNPDPQLVFYSPSALQRLLSFLPSFPFLLLRVFCALAPHWFPHCRVSSSLMSYESSQIRRIFWMVASLVVWILDVPGVVESVLAMTVKGDQGCFMEGCPVWLSTRRNSRKPGCAPSPVTSSDPCLQSQTCPFLDRESHWEWILSPVCQGSGSGFFILACKVEAIFRGVNDSAEERVGGSEGVNKMLLGILLVIERKQKFKAGWCWCQSGI